MSDDEADREAILRRRNRLIGVALAGLTVSASATACACLSTVDAGREGGTSEDAGPQACLSRPPDDAGAFDGGAFDGGALDGGTPDGSAFDAGDPMPCLSPPLPEDAGTGEA